MTRFLLAVALAAIPLASVGACHTDRVNAAATKPTSPANGAADYQNAPGGPATAPTPPTVGTEPGAATTPEPAAVDSCPPTCASDGSWIGCGLKKPRGTGCVGCTPKCKGKGTADEGWYDCNGVMIAQRKCS